MHPRLGFFLLVVGPTSCTVPALDLVGKSCPCISGFVCDPATNTCVVPPPAATGTDGTATGTRGGGSSGDAVASEESSGDTGSAEPAFEVTSFTARWATPNTIRWQWEVVGDPADFGAYEVVVGSSPQDVAGRSNVTVFDGTINPELDRYYLPRTSGEEPVVATVTDGLTPDTLYYAQLVVTDTGGRQAQSPNVAVVRTGLPPSFEAAIFADDFTSPPGTILPRCYAGSTTDPAAGVNHYEYVVRCDADSVSTCVDVPDPAAQCFENLRWQGMTLPVAGISEGAFVSAYLEFALAVDGTGVDGEGPAHGWWTEVRIGASGNTYGFAPLTFRADGEYRTYQIKLSDLGLTHAELAGVVEGFRVGSAHPHGAAVRIDEVYVRW